MDFLVGVLITLWLLELIDHVKPGGVIIETWFDGVNVAVWHLAGGIIWISLV